MLIHRIDRIVEHNHLACRSLEEWKLLKELVAAEGTGNWRQKAETLATGRTAKALELKWARHGGVLTPQVRRS